MFYHACYMMQCYVVCMLCYVVLCAVYDAVLPDVCSMMQCYVKCYVMCYMTKLCNVCYVMHVM